MARIENSLSNTPRKKKLSTSNGSITTTLINANANPNSISNLDEISIHNQFSPESKSNSLKSLPTCARISQNGNGTLIYKTSKDITREMEALKTALKDKEAVIDKWVVILHAFLVYKAVDSLKLLRWSG